jgi:phosphomannomutase
VNFLQLYGSEKYNLMALIKSISGIRGTIGGKPGESLSPVDVVKFSAAYGTWILRRRNAKKTTIVIGRDGRNTGKMVSNLVATTLQALGIDVTDLGMASTPTVEVAVTGLKAGGGIIITASHNPANWNALKLLNEKGEFLSAADGNEILDIVSSGDYSFEEFDKLGTISTDNSWDEKHIEQIIKLELVDIKAIKSASLTVAVDCINSVGGIILPLLLKKLGVKKVILLNSVSDGNFAHNPEPLPENLKEISGTVLKEKADVGFVVDPDVDRLAIICEDGSMFGEEYTLVAVADYILQNTSGNTVSNMSSTRALKDVTESYGGSYFSSAVGEVNVVEEMKKREAVIGGEGNGGIIYPVLHYGRDALAGIALFLSYLSVRKMKCSDLRKSYPEYVIAKKKLTLDPGTDVDKILESVRKYFAGHKIDERDGMKIDHKEGWVHIRKSNTEPIIRIYAEGKSSLNAENLADEVIMIVKKL